jgi:hypothetical protein
VCGLGVFVWGSVIDRIESKLGLVVVLDVCGGKCDF